MCLMYVGSLSDVELWWRRFSILGIDWRISHKREPRALTLDPGAADDEHILEFVHHRGIKVRVLCGMRIRLEYDALH